MKYLILFLGLSCLASCVEESIIPPVELGYDYYPLAVNDYHIYNVDSTVSQSGQADTTYSFQIKEVQESEITDNEGRTAIRIERYKRDNDTLAWSLEDVWTSYKGLSYAEKTEEDVRYLKLGFPINDAAEWDGNSFNTGDARTFSYKSLHEAKTVNGFNFDSTVVAVFEDNNLISPKKDESVYAKHVGLVKRVWKNFPQNTNNGTEMIVELIEYSVH